MSDRHPTLEAGGVRWWLAPGARAEIVAPRIERALEALEAGARDRKRGRRKSLFVLDLAGVGGPDHLLKVNRYPGGWRRRSKARHELALAAALAARGLPAPVPAAAGERRRGGRLEACFLLVPLLPDTTDLRRELADRPPPARARALAAALGRLGRALHDAGLHQDDFQPNNFLVRWRSGAPELFVIDFERARLRRRVPDRLRHRALAKLDRELGRASSSLRLRFLHAYCDGDRTEARSRWRAVQAEARRLARRDAAHLFRNATRPGRRFEAVRLPGLRGVALPGLDPARLEGAAQRGLAGGARVAGAPAAEEWSVRIARAGVGPARRALARALVLAARGLAPPPLGVLCGAEASVLVLARGERALAADEVRRNASLEAAERVLRRRLEAYGRLAGPPDPSETAVEPLRAGSVRARLLGVESFAVASRAETLPAPLAGALGALRPRSDGRGARAARSR